MDLHHAHRDSFTVAEAGHLASLMDEAGEFGPRKRIARAHDPMTGILFVAQGFAASYRSDRLGRRQILNLHIPGDFLDLSSCMLGCLDHDLEALTAVSLRAIPAAAVRQLQDRAPGLLAGLWRISLRDAAIQRQWIFRLGRLQGRARITDLFAEMLLRQHARALATTERFDLPLTQGELAEACGMTAVHANRMVRELRQEGICTFQRGAVTVTDFPRLLRTANFCWDYLHLPAGVEALLHDQLRAGGSGRSTPRRAGSGGD